MQAVLLSSDFLTWKNENFSFLSVLCVAKSRLIWQKSHLLCWWCCWWGLCGDFFLIFFLSKSQVLEKGVSKLNPPKFYQPIQEDMFYLPPAFAFSWAISKQAVLSNSGMSKQAVGETSDVWKLPSVQLCFFLSFFLTSNFYFFKILWHYILEIANDWLTEDRVSLGSVLSWIPLRAGLCFVWCFLTECGQTFVCSKCLRRHTCIFVLVCSLHEDTSEDSCLSKRYSYISCCEMVTFSAGRSRSQQKQKLLEICHSRWISFPENWSQDGDARSTEKAKHESKVRLTIVELGTVYFVCLASVKLQGFWGLQYSYHLEVWKIYIIHVVHRGDFTNMCVCSDTHKQNASCEKMELHWGQGHRVTQDERPVFLASCSLAQRAGVCVSVFKLL